MLMPSVIEKIGGSSRAFDLPTKLLTDRIIVINGAIDEHVSNSVIMQLLWLNSDNPNEDIDLYINSPGGDVLQGYAIFDIMENLQAKVNTIGIGLVASMGTFLLASGTGTRRATKNTRIMLHSVSSGSQGTYHDLKIDFEETQELNHRITRQISEFSKGKATPEEIAKLTERDFWMGPERAIDLGLIDLIVGE